jgi:uncharacterized protein (DUF952 family)
MPDEPIFHLTEPSVWEESQARGEHTQSTRGASLDEVGYIHGSFAHQVAMVAGFVYGDWDGDLVLLEIDPGGVPSEIRVEGVDGGSEQFPHIYGPLPITAVRAVHRLTGPTDASWRS